MGTNLVSALAYERGGLRKEVAYEENRDLPIGITYSRPDGTPLVIRTQINDALGRPQSRSQQRGDNAPVHYSYQYNTRSELTYATRDTEEYRYQYDNIGNRESSSEELTRTDYLTNPLNQYTGIQPEGEPDFQPEYDADGNQTVIRTKGGYIYDVEYNAENRPVKFTVRQPEPFIYYMECFYDYLGRRFKTSNYSFGWMSDCTDIPPGKNYVDKRDFKEQQMDKPVENERQKPKRFTI